MKIIKSILTGLLFSVFIIIATSFIISFVYEDEISQLFIKELNKRIKADIQTESVDLSLLQKFPGASVEFEQVSFYTKEDKDTVLSFKAKRMFFQFDIIDIFTKDVNIDKIDIQDGYCKVLTNNKISIKSKTPDEKNINLNLNKLTIKDFNYIILNDNKNFELRGFTKKTTIDGNISSSENNLNIVSESFIKNLKINEFSYIKSKNIKFSGNVYSNPEIYRLNESILSLEKLPFNFQGEYNRKMQEIDVSVTGDNLKISELNLYIPWEFQKKYNNIVIKSGRLNLFARAKGEIKNTIPGIEIDFSVSKVNVEIKKDKNFNLKGINVNGYFSNGRHNKPSSSFLIFENFEATSDISHFKGNMELTNFLNPFISIKGSVASELKLLNRYINHPEFKAGKGTLLASLAFETYLNKPVDLTELIDQKRLSGDMTFKNASFQYKNYRVNELSGFAYLDQSIFHINGLGGRINDDSDFSLSGSIEHLEDHIKDSTISINFKGTLNSDHLNLSGLFPKEDTNNEKTLKLPASINTDMRLNINSLKWGDFTATNVKGNLNSNPKRLTVNNLSLKSMQGHANLNAEIIQNSNGSYQLKTHSYLKTIDINRAFQVFNNFGQEYIRDNNIQGLLSGEIFLSSKLDPSLKIQTESLSNVSDFTILDGELIDFEPLNSLSRFVKLSELKHVNFSKLTNKITIKDQVITIPEMEIQSSAIDLKIKGYHKFNGNYQYRVNLLLSELLSNKADEEIHKYGTVSEDEAGRTRLFLILNGINGKTEVKYDKESVKAKIKEDIQKEKHELKTILNEEFGLFKNDTSLKRGKQEDSDSFKIQWEEEEKKKEEKPVKKKKKKKTKSDFIIKWEEDTLTK